MKPILEDDILRYRRDGFLVIDEFLDSTQLALWRDRLDLAIRERVSRFPWSGPEYEGANHAKLFTQRVNLWQTNSQVADLVLAPGSAELVARLEGVEGVRIWRDQALIKHAYAEATPFHADVPLWSFTSESAATLWIALDDADATNGCLCYLPGTHLAGDPEPYETLNIGDVFMFHPEWEGIQPVVCPVQAGGACIHNGLTIHAAFPNLTTRSRRAMTISYMPVGVSFNGRPNVLPTLLLKELRRGDLLSDEINNPLVYGKDE